jgi:glycosyltransferase involved in cell wall biosynthesis
LPPFASRARRILFEQLQLPRRLRRDGVDLLFNPAFTGPLWGARRIVTAVPDLYHQVIPEALDPGQRRFLKLMVPLCCRASWRVLTISHTSARDLVRFYPWLKDRIGVILLGSKFAEGAAATPREPANPPYLLMVANLTANKNPAAVVAAVARFRREVAPMQLRHVGHDLLGQLRDAIAAADAGGWAFSEADLSDAALAARFRGAFALAIPSLYEGFGMPVLEGQSLGVPVLCSDRGALPEVAGEGALFFDPTDADALFLRLAELAGDPMLADRLVAAGHANVGRFSWEACARAFLSECDLPQPRP